MTAVALMGRETSRIELGTAVVPLQSRHPVAFGSAGAVGAGGVRRTLPPRRRALAPLDHRLDARPALRAAREVGRELPRRVRRHVRRARVRSTWRTTTSASTTRSTSPTSPVPVFLAALGPVMLRMAGERAAGTVLWMADERAIAEHVVPKITKAAEDAGRPAPRVVAGVAVCLCASNEVEGAIERANGPSGTPSTRRTTSGCWSRASPTTSATCRPSAPRPTSSGGCARTWTPAPPTSRRASCRWGATRTRSSRRRGAHARVPRVAGTRAHMSGVAASRPPSPRMARLARSGGRAPRCEAPRAGREMTTRGDLLWPSIPTMALDAAARFGDAHAVVDRRSSHHVHRAGRRRPTGHGRSDRHRSRAGERAAVWSPNRYEWLVAALGILGAGGAVVPVNTRFKGEEVRYILDRSGARVVFTVGEFLGVDYAATLAGLRSELPAPADGRGLRRRHCRRPVAAPSSRRRGDAVDDDAVDARIGAVARRRRERRAVHVGHHRGAQGRAA